MAGMEEAEEHVDDPSENSRNEVHPWPYISDHFSFVEKRGDSFIRQCKLCVPKKTTISAYKNSTSNLRKHVEVNHVPFPQLNQRTSAAMVKLTTGWL